MYQTTRRHISEGRDIDNDVDIYVCIWTQAHWGIRRKMSHSCT